jgi:hypothetical protein
MRIACKFDITISGKLTVPDNIILSRLWDRLWRSKIASYQNCAEKAQAVKDFHHKIWDKISDEDKSILLTSQPVLTTAPEQAADSDASTTDQEAQKWPAPSCPLAQTEEQDEENSTLTKSKVANSKALALMKEDFHRLTIQSSAIPLLLDDGIDRGAYRDATPEKIPAGIRRHSAIHVIQENGCKALKMQANHEIVPLHGIQVVLSSMMKFIHLPSVRFHAFEVLRKLTQYDIMSNLVINGVLGAVLVALKIDADNDVRQADGLAILIKCLAQFERGQWTDALANKSIAEGLSDAFISAMAKHPKNFSIQRLGCQGLWGFTRVLIRSELIGETPASSAARAVEVVLLAMKEFPKNSVVQHGLSLLEVMIRYGQANVIIRSGGIQTVLISIANHVGDPGVCKVGIMLLQELQYGGSESQGLFDASFSIGTVLSVMGHHPKDSAIQQHSLKLLDDLKKSMGVRDWAIVFADEGGIEVCLSSMKMHFNDLCIQQYGCVALNAIVKIGLRQRIADAGGVDLVIDAIKNFSCDTMILQYGGNTVDYLFSPDNDEDEDETDLAAID